MNWATALRGDLQQRARAFADEHHLPYYLSRGDPPTVLFGRPPDGSGHGNFHPDAWAAIRANGAWRQRVEKPHPQRQALPPEKASGALELDSCNSSDALLMNCFCPPGAAQRVLAALGYADGDEAPEFGFKPGVQLLPEGADTTEIDMRVGAHLFEAKLTEADFTERPRAVVLRYRSLARVFDVDALPWNGDTLMSYQLVRNVLAAEEHGGSFTLLCDQRRPDLLHAWWTVHAAIRGVDLRRRCGFRTWQEIAAVSLPTVADWLRAKYGL